MQNIIIRDYAKEKRVWLWEISDYLHVADYNFSRRLRKELPINEQREILDIIDIIAERKAQHDETGNN